jgi:hypothetical protein
MIAHMGDKFEETKSKHRIELKYMGRVKETQKIKQFVRGTKVFMDT